MGRSDRDRSFDEHHEPLLRPLSAGPHNQEHPPSPGRTGEGGDAFLGSHSRKEPRQPDLVHRARMDQTEVNTLADIGTFRAVRLADLARYQFGGDTDEALLTVNRLVRQGLAEYRTTSPDSTTYVTLTILGRSSIQQLRSRTAPHQEFYSGLVKPREARHDAALYRLYQHEASHITARNARITRVVLDFELKRSINRRLSKIGRLTQSQQQKHKQEIAQEHGLKVVNGKIPIPDLRLEYEGPNHEQAKVDLELVTGHYHRGNLATKAKAGFAMYALSEDAARLRPAMDDPEIMQDILSL